MLTGFIWPILNFSSLINDRLCRYFFWTFDLLQGDRSAELDFGVTYGALLLKTKRVFYDGAYFPAIRVFTWR